MAAPQSLLPLLAASPASLLEALATGCAADWLSEAPASDCWARGVVSSESSLIRRLVWAA